MLSNYRYSHTADSLDLRSENGEKFLGTFYDAMLQILGVVARFNALLANLVVSILYLDVTRHLGLRSCLE